MSSAIQELPVDPAMPRFREASSGASGQSFEGEAIHAAGRQAAFRLVRGLVLSHLKLRNLSRPGEALTEESLLTEEEFGLDSLARLELIARLTRVFELQRSGVEDYMLNSRCFGDWVDLLLRHWEILGESAAIVFQTSGSTGQPQSVRHLLSRLLLEVASHAESTLKLRPERIVSLVPSEHIYGCLFTALLPDHLGIPVLDLASSAPSRLAREGCEGDLVVGTPFIFEALFNSVPSLPGGMCAVVSTAPVPQHLWRRSADAGLQCLSEIYGATETGGVGVRHAEDAPFELLPHLAFASETPGGAIAVTIRTDGTVLPVQDRLARRGLRHFSVLGRRDGMVQVGGVNVNPDVTRRRIACVQGVAEAVVRLHCGRLHAFVVPSDPAADVAALVALIRKELTEALSAPARPDSITTGPGLPRDAMGKLRPWWSPDGSSA